MQERVYPRAFSHIGITVPDLDKAVEFYETVLGFYVIMRPTEIVEDPNTAIGIMCQDVFGPGYAKFRIAHMSTADKIGVELVVIDDLLSTPDFVRQSANRLRRLIRQRLDPRL